MQTPFNCNNCQQENPLCDEISADCHFEQKTLNKGVTVHNDYATTNYLIYCQSGHVRISSTLFHDEILCAGEVMFVPRQGECTGFALSDVSLLIHRFNNTVCCSEKCILSYLYSHRHIKSKVYCCKLTASDSLQELMNSVTSYIADQTQDLSLWHMKHKELIWIFTHYYSIEELYSFFHPMTDEQVPFKSLVLTHYRKACYSDNLAELCGYSLYTFRRMFKKEFGIPAHQWLLKKRAENVLYRLTMLYIPFSDIIEEFSFSSPQQFNRFCKINLGDTPSNIRQRYIEG